MNAVGKDQRTAGEEVGFVPAGFEREFREVTAALGLREAPQPLRTLGMVAGEEVGGKGWPDGAVELWQEADAVPSVEWLGEPRLLRERGGRGYVLACLPMQPVSLRMIGRLKRELEPFGLAARFYPGAGWIPGYPLILIARRKMLRSLPAVRRGQ